jgi:hypothetical protein
MNITPESSFHQPNVVMQPECGKNCRRLGRLIEQAVLDSVDEPNAQKVIVCQKYGRTICNGYVHEQDKYFENIGEPVEGSELHYRPNPTSYGLAGSGNTVDTIIESALGNGAQQYTTDGRNVVELV